MNPEVIYDIIGIGIGPFNLSLAALCSEIPDLKCIFFDMASEFNWHPGMMLENARLQVPFFADLTTLVNPRSEYTFLSYLNRKGEMIPFFNQESNFPFRAQYNEYCNWTASGLSSLSFNHLVSGAGYSRQEGCYSLSVQDTVTKRYKVYYTKHLVLGIGTEPLLPPFATELNHPHVLHSSEYLNEKDELLNLPSVSIIGSGQSAAEIFCDLLQRGNFNSLNWFTRSERIFPMDYTRFCIEMTSHDYIDFFFSLSPQKKAELLKTHDSLYKGINASLIEEIHTTLYSKYRNSKENPVNIMPGVELRSITTLETDLQLELYHTLFERSFLQQTSAVILATGYKPRYPSFFKNIHDRINWLDKDVLGVARNYSIDITGGQIFVQNAELHTHGFSAPDLGLGPYRNATILNTILGYEHFKLEKKTAFQNFGFKNSKSAFEN
jgi:lysine N6-hydroxylase